MTVLELLLAIAMLVVFTGVVVMVMEFTLRFFKAAESGPSNTFSNGVLIDHGQLHIAMDALVEVLSQPGVNVMAIASSKDDEVDGACTHDPVSRWALSQPYLDKLFDKGRIDALLPPDYRLCLLKTDATKQEAAATVGIYLLLALPQKLSESSLPTRRLFCHPRPYC